MSMTRQEVLLALAGGREVQREFKDGSTYFSSSWAWSCLDPKESWEKERWRIKPVPKRVPLEAKDVPPGSVIKAPGTYPGCWYLVFSVVPDNICCASTGTVRFEQLMELGYQISRDGGKTWEKCEKEVAE